MSAMIKHSPIGAFIWVLAASLSVLSFGCNTEETSTNIGTSIPPTPTAAATPAKPATPPKASAKPASPPVDEETAKATYERALDAAYSAATIAQSAQSPEDWNLVETQWQQAVEMLKTVPTGSAVHQQAQTKISEYQDNAGVAKQQSQVAKNRPKPEEGMVVRNLGSLNASFFSVPIVRRLGGTAVINVTFNGERSYPMIVDTGASGTVITAGMATTLGVDAHGAMQASTPSAKNVTFEVGKVNSIEVGGATIRNVTVAIAPQLDVGLLGQDFFSNYDVTVKQDVVEFRAR